MVLLKEAVDKGQTICNCGSIFKNVSLSRVQVEVGQVVLNRKEVQLMGDPWQPFQTRGVLTTTKRKCMWRESSHKETRTRHLNNRATSCG